MERAKVSLWLWAVLAVFNSYSQAGSNVLLPPESRRCACSNDILTFNCTIIGGGITQWSGTAFDCEHNLNEILLLHENFDDPGGTDGTCNNGQIVGRSVSVIENCYTSQVSVTTSAELNNKTVRCIHNTEVIPIGEILLTIISAGYIEPPTNVSLWSVQLGALIFAWSPVDPTNCALEEYNITSDGCGTCSVNNKISATCTDLQLSTNTTQCAFSIQSVVCGFSGTLSNLTVVHLKVPDAPNIQEILPIYMANTQALTKVGVSIIQPTTFNFTDNIPGPVTHYNFSFSPGNNSIAVNAPTCDSDDCKQYEVDVPSSVCSLSTNFYVNVSAANRLGQGPPSQPNIIECTNQFVKVEYDPAASTITCVFESRNSNHSCNISYGSCQQEMNQAAQGSATMEFPNQVVIKIESSGSDCYMYVVKATNGTFTVIVKGNFNIESRGASNTAAIVIGVLVSLLSLVILVIACVAVAIYVIRRKTALNVSNDVNDSNDENNATDSDTRDPDKHNLELHQPKLTLIEEAHEDLSSFR